MKERSITSQDSAVVRTGLPISRNFSTKIGDPVMYIRILALFVLAFLLFVTPNWATTAVCTPGDGFIACQFVQGTTNVTGTFDFGVDGVISFQFDTVLTSFELDVTAVEDAPFSFTGPDFPDPGTTTCIPYNGPNGNGGHCVRYNVTGAPLPVKGVNFRGLITVLLNYDSTPIFNGIPAFGHAPGDTTTAAFSEDILTFYVDPNAPACPSCDPGMGGKIPGISSFEAFKKPFANGAQGDVICSPGVTAMAQNSTSGNNPIVEVSFKIVAAGGNCDTGPFLRDKTATLSVGTTDPNNINNVVPQPLVNGGDSNKFHFNNQNGVNVQDINANGLQSGTYFVTVMSTVFSPVNTQFTIP